MSETRRVLMVSPHFPPDSGAASHRVRLLAPYLAANGWTPTVVTVQPDAYEGTIEPALEGLVPASLRVVRSPAWRASQTRPFGFGDLGLRALTGLRSTCDTLLRRERFDVLFVTVHPVYPALLGPWLKGRHHVKFVIDYQDPWVGGWGLTVGAGPNGTADRRSRWARRVGALLEPRVVRSADAITAVSAGTYEAIAARQPTPLAVPTLAIPLGWEAHDVEAARAARLPNRHFDPADGRIHLCYVGTLLPAGMETASALFAALRTLLALAPACRDRIRIHFIGTSNQSTPGQMARALPLATKEQVADVVTEHPERIGYLDALTVLDQSSAILLLGSTEPHYTASKIFPALMARRPLLAAFHRASSVCDVLGAIGRPPTIRVVAYDDRQRAASTVPALAQALRELIERPEYRAADVDLDATQNASAATMARQLAQLFDRITERAA
jgi:glycosyltransferase involved in cell wall biosynthesis